MKNLRILFFSFVTTLVAFSHAHAAENPYAVALEDWQKVLTQYVDKQGRVDFIGVSENPDALARYVAFVAEISPSSHPQYFKTDNAVMAYHINTYNALAMQGVIDRGIPKGFTSVFKRASFFKFRSVVIGGQKTNLYDYENGVIRPLNEPRSHFALNCMVKDCPRLPQEAFLETTLDAQLESATIEFLNSDKHVKVDDKKNEVRLSGIMKFYTKDFVASGKKQDLLSYVNPYRTNKIPSDYKVKYIDYDWRINAQ